jgi:hypothetical protein
VRACAIFRAIKIDGDAEELSLLVAVNAMCSVAFLSGYFRAAEDR